MVEHTIGMALLPVLRDHDLRAQAAERRDLAALAEPRRSDLVRLDALIRETVPTLTALRERGFLLGLMSNCSAQAGAVLERIGLGRTSTP